MAGSTEEGVTSREMAWARPVHRAQVAGLLLDPPLTLVGGLQIFACFLLRALRVVLGANRQVVLAHCTLALSADVENLPQVDVSPDLGPFRLQVAVQRLAELVGGRLEIVLQEKYFGDAIVRE